MIDFLELLPYTNCKQQEEEKVKAMAEAVNKYMNSLISDSSSETASRSGSPCSGSPTDLSTSELYKTLDTATSDNCQVTNDDVQEA
jgi:hypothetical protein